MASVWIARQTGKHGFQRLVAVKTILPKYAAEPKFQRMFIDEARIASQIEHVNVTQILDVGEQHGVTYLVMEYVDGDGLSKVNRAADKRGKPLPLGVLLRVMADVCGGLHAAHELRDDDGLLLGVVHRDVSPQNILVTTKGIAKLIDFGIAKARDRLSGDTNVDQLKGKVQYMAPEQAVGRSTDRRADVWAVGAVLYHMLAGKAPFEGDNEIQTLFRLSSGRPPVPLPSTVHPAVAAVVRRSLAHSAEGRYETAADLQHALEDAMAQARVMTSTTGVADCLAELMEERATKRRESIALGLTAADERERVAGIMRSNAESTNQSSIVPKANDATLVTRPDSTTSATAHTLGSSSMSIPLERRRGPAAAVVGGVAIGAAVIIGVLATRSSHVPPAAASPAATTPVSALPAPPAPPPATAPSASTTPPVRLAPSTPADAPQHPAPWRWAPPAGTAKPTSKPRVNDGF